MTLATVYSSRRASSSYTVTAASDSHNDSDICGDISWEAVAASPVLDQDRVFCAARYCCHLTSEDMHVVTAGIASRTTFSAARSMTSLVAKTFPRSTPTIGSNLTIDSEQGGLACLRMRHDVGVLPAGARPALLPDVRVLCRVPRSSGRTRPARHARLDLPHPISFALRCHAPCPSRLVSPDSARPRTPHPAAGGGSASMLTCFTIRRRTSGAQNHPTLLSRVHYNRGAHRMRSVLPVPPDVLIFSAASSILLSTGLPSKLCTRTTVARRLSSSHSSVSSVAP